MLLYVIISLELVESLTRQQKEGAPCQAKAMMTQGLTLPLRAEASGSLSLFLQSSSAELRTKFQRNVSQSGAKEVGCVTFSLVHAHVGCVEGDISPQDEMAPHGMGF